MFSYLRGWAPGNQAKINGLVDRVTARVQNAVRRRVSDRLPDMSVHEARGYIRARAAAAVRREMGIVMAEEPTLRRAEATLVVSSVRNRVVRRLLLENLRRIEPTHNRQRRAA